MGFKTECRCDPYMCHQRERDTETEWQTESVVTNSWFPFAESSSQYERPLGHSTGSLLVIFFFKCSDFSLKRRTLGQWTEYLAVYFLWELCSAGRCGVSFFLPFVNVDSYWPYFLDPKVETCLHRSIKNALGSIGGMITSTLSGGWK